MSGWLDRGRKYGVFPNGDGPLSQMRRATRHRGFGPWHIIGDPGEPAFQNNWELSTTESAQFVKDDYGLVHVKFGMTSRYDGGSGGTVFTLPVGFRPAIRTSLLAMVGTSVAFPTLFGRIDITTGGAVIVQSNAKSLTAGDMRFRIV